MAVDATGRAAIPMTACPKCGLVQPLSVDPALDRRLANSHALACMGKGAVTPQDHGYGHGV
jgi:hypothetical protein